MTFDTQPLVVDGHLVESAFQAANQEPRRTKKNQEDVVASIARLARAKLGSTAMAPAVSDLPAWRRRIRIYRHGLADEDATRSYRHDAMDAKDL